MNQLSKYEDPVGEYAFHVTSQENTDSILEHGIKHSEDSGPDTATIDTVLKDLSYDSPFPFNRTNVTYCHIDAEFVANSLPSQTDTPLISDEVAIVIEVAQITAPMYLADMSVVSGLIDYRHGGADIMIHADTPEQAVENYRNSITAVESPDDIASQAKTLNAAELIVDGDIPCKAIVDIVE